MFAKFQSNFKTAIMFLLVLVDDVLKSRLLLHRQLTRNRRKQMISLRAGPNKIAQIIAHGQFVKRIIFDIVILVQCVVVVGVNVA